MKILKILLFLLVCLGAAVAFGRFFLSELGSGRTEELAAVVITAPPGYAVVERGEIPATAAAALLEEQALRPGAGKVGVRFEREGAVVYWLADVSGEVLEEREAGESGTRVQKQWSGGLRARLAWARSHGDFSAPGLPPPEIKNLYH
ncbi:MAG TPA: hypothetical protein VIW92_12100 [Thermoanaerobaculia bacterium]